MILLLTTHNYFTKAWTLLSTVSNYKLRNRLKSIFNSSNGDVTKIAYWKTHSISQSENIYSIKPAALLRMGAPAFANWRATVLAHSARQRFVELTALFGRYNTPTSFATPFGDAVEFLQRGWPLQWKLEELQPNRMEKKFYSLETNLLWNQRRYHFKRWYR